MATIQLQPYSYYDRVTAITDTTGATARSSYADVTNSERLSDGGITLTNGPLGVTATTNNAGSTTYYTRDPSGRLLDRRPADGGAMTGAALAGAILGSTLLAVTGVAVLTALEIVSSLPFEAVTRARDVHNSSFVFDRGKIGV